MWKRFNSSELRAAMSDYLRAVMYYPLSIPKVYMLIRGGAGASAGACAPCSRRDNPGEAALEDLLKCKKSGLRETGARNECLAAV